MYDYSMRVDAGPAFSIQGVLQNEARSQRDDSPVQMEVALALSHPLPPPVAEWINASLRGDRREREITLRAVKSGTRAASVLAYERCRMVEVIFPALTAGGKDGSHVTVVVVPVSMKRQQPGDFGEVARPKVKTRVDDFKLMGQGVVFQGVESISALGWRLDERGGGTISTAQWVVDAQRAGHWQAWYDAMSRGQPFPPQVLAIGYVDSKQQVAAALHLDEVSLIGVQVGTRQQLTDSRPVSIVTVAPGGMRYTI